jgi:hypothetical protein
VAHSGEMNKIQKLAAKVPHSGLIPLLSIMSVEEKLLTFKSKTFKQYFDEDCAWVMEYSRQTPNKDRMKTRVEQLAGRGGW